MRRDQAMILAAAAAAAILAGTFTWYISSLPTHRPDFAVMWAAAQQADFYDPAALDSALQWEARYPVAFVYPPTALPLFVLLGLLPMRVALTSWAALSAAAMTLASRSKWAPLLLLTPSLLWVIPGGQTSVLLGALLLGSLLLLRRPVLSGILLGMALALKPPLALAFPLLLLIERKWKVVIATVGCYAAIAGVSAVMFGLEQWAEWARSVPEFVKLHESTEVLQRNEIASGLPLWLRLVAVAAGAWLAAIALRGGHRLEAFVIAGGAGMIGSVHAMGYEFAMLAAAAPMLIARGRWSASAIFLFLLVPGFIWFGLPPYPFRLLAVLLLIAAAAFDSILAGRRSDRDADAGLAFAARS